VLVESGEFFPGLERLLDGPAPPGDVDELGQWDGLGRVCAVSRPVRAGGRGKRTRAAGTSPTAYQYRQRPSLRGHRRRVPGWAGRGPRWVSSRTGPGRGRLPPRTCRGWWSRISGHVRRRGVRRV